MCIRDSFRRSYLRLKKLLDSAFSQQDVSFGHRRLTNKLYVLCYILFVILLQLRVNRRCTYRSMMRCMLVADGMSHGSVRHQQYWCHCQPAVGRLPLRAPCAPLVVMQ
eukprot:1532215-Heterocapsa_arctica.AAC.1